jgi:hypothetical protein
MVAKGAAQTALAGRIDALAIETRNHKFLSTRRVMGNTRRRGCHSIWPSSGITLTATSAPEGALVYMTARLVRWL